MSLWDNVKKFTQPYADDDYDDYDDEEMDFEEEEEIVEEAPRQRRRNPFATSEPAGDYTVPPASAASGATASATATASTGFGGHVVNMGPTSGSKQEVVLFHAKAFEDAAKAADELKKRRAIILNMENVDKALTRRVVDFLSGCIYAMEGNVKKIAQSTYLFCPHSMEIVGDLESFQTEPESYI